MDLAHKVVDREGLSGGQVKKRAKEVADGDWAAKAVKDAIAAAQAAVTAAVVATTASTAATVRLTRAPQASAEVELGVAAALELEEQRVAPRASRRASHSTPASSPRGALVITGPKNAEPSKWMVGVPTS